MPRRCHRAAFLFAAAALGAVAAGACGGANSLPSASKYAGLWVNADANNVIWLHVTAHGGKATVRWERDWHSPEVHRARLQSDGTLKVMPVLLFPGSSLDGSPTFTAHLTADSHLNMSTTTRVQGVDAVIPVALHFVRGSQTKYTVFAARMNKHLAEQAVSDDYGQALSTISEGIGLWQDKHGLKVPPVSVVRPGGAIERALIAAGKSWSRMGNGKLLVPGNGRGEYTYHPLAHGYRIGGLAPNGQGPQTVATSW